MHSRRCLAAYLVIAFAALVLATDARAQAPTALSHWVFDAGGQIDPTINGNINSGAIGTLEGRATAILPNSYGDVYGAGIGFHFGGGYVLNPMSEIRGQFTWQSADAKLVRMGDIGASSLYGQYSDYKSFGLDVGYRQYFFPDDRRLRPFGEGLIGVAWIDQINVQFAAPTANAVFQTNDFYDSSAAFTWNLAGGMLVGVGENVDLVARMGVRYVGGLSEVDQFVGTGLESINSDTSRLTFPISIGIRFSFR